MKCTNNQFNAETKAKERIARVKDWFGNESGGAKGAVVGISGGKDSSVVAKLLCEAIGKEKVFGVMLPNGVQKDIKDSEKLCDFLGIDNCVIDIEDSYNGILKPISDKVGVPSKESCINIAPRLRMTVLYLLAQSKEYRVIGTGNLSEGYVGYFTKWGDMACDFNPLANLTSDEVIAIGCFLGLPHELMYKTPSDGLSGLSDEERFGFTYEELNKYIREGVCHNAEIKPKIDNMHLNSEHKRAITARIPS